MYREPQCDEPPTTGYASDSASRFCVNCRVYLHSQGDTSAGQLIIKSVVKSTPIANKCRALLTIWLFPTRFPLFQFVGLVVVDLRSWWARSGLAATNSAVSVVRVL